MRFSLFDAFMHAYTIHSMQSKRVFAAVPSSSAHPERVADVDVRFWDRIARRYAASSVADQAGYERTLARVSTLLSKDHLVLELGCGTGVTALRLAPYCKRLHATDASPAMIAIARERWQAQPMTRLSFAALDAGIALDDTVRYDRVLAFNLLHLVDDLDQLIVDIARALRPGGLFISKTPCVQELNPLITRVGIPVLRIFGKVPPLHIFDQSRLLGAVSASGLEIANVERHGTRGKDIRAFIVARKPRATMPRAA